MRSHRLTSLFVASVLFAQATLPAFAGVFATVAEARSHVAAAKQAKPGKPLPKVWQSFAKPTFGRHSHSANVELPTFGSIINDAGMLYTGVTPAHVAKWKSSTDPLSRIRYAEWTLVGGRQPIPAEELFNRILQDRTALAVHGLARLGKAVSLSVQGRYRESITHFEKLRATSGGFDPLLASGWQRDTEAKLGLHTNNEKKGIFQPWRLDPLCGVRSAGKVLTRFGIPYDEAKMKKTVGHDGFGSSIKQIADGIESQGYKATVMACQPEIVAHIPLPAVAHVEHDHFVAVTYATEKEVRYWCVDCGGEQSVTMAQWKLMACDTVLFATERGSAEDVFASAGAKGVSLIVAGPAGLEPRFSRMTEFGHVLPPYLFLEIVCTLMPQCPCPCLEDTDTAGHGSDPVSVFSGQEIYNPGPNLVANNPSGPDVNWGHSHYSFKRTLENGLGNHWSHPYNMAVVTSNVPNQSGQQTEVGDSFFIIQPDGGYVGFSLPGNAVLSASNPSIALTPGDVRRRTKLTWKYDTATSSDYFEILQSDGSKITTGGFEPARAAGDGTTTLGQPYYQWVFGRSRLFRPVTIADALNNFITLEYEVHSRTVDHATFYLDFVYPLSILKRIKDQNGAELLSLSIGSNGTYTAATAYPGTAHAQKVIYSVTHFPSQNMDGLNGMYYLASVSEVVSPSASSGNVAESFGYSLVHNSVGNNELIHALTSIAVPSANGSGMATTTMQHGNVNLGQDIGIIKVTAPDGTTMELDYDAPGSMETVVTWKSSAGATERTITYGYDVKGHRTHLKNATGQIMESRTYGAFHFPATVKDGENHTWTLNWAADANGNYHLNSVTSPRNTVTTYTYAALPFPNDRLIETQTGSLGSTQYEYYPNGLLNKVHTPVPGNQLSSDKQTTTYAYDALGNVTRVESPGRQANKLFITKANYTNDGGYSQPAKQGQPLVVSYATKTGTDPEVDIADEKSRYRYDARGNVIQQYDALNNLTTTVYDIADQVIEVQYAAAVAGNPVTKSVPTYAYQYGPLTSAKFYGENGQIAREITNAYNAIGELTGTDGSTEKVSYTYNSYGALKTLTDGNNNVTTCSYNLSGQPTQVSMPGATSGDYDKIQFLSYNNSGKLLSWKDGRGQTTVNSCDEPDGQLTKVDGAFGQIINTYDNYGRLVSTLDPTGLAEGQVDDLGNVLTATRTYSGTSPVTFNYSYTYDGLRETLSTPAGTNTYVYDSLGRYTSMGTPVGTVSSTWDLNSRQTKRTLPNGSWTDYGYDLAGRMTSLVNKRSSTVTYSNYTNCQYDQAWNLQGWEQTQAAPGTSSGNLFQGVTSYEYDNQVLGAANKNRLTKETSSRFNGFTELNAYDAASNPTTFRNTASIPYNGNNQRTGPLSYVYDGNGNPTTYRNKTATYDHFNRLTNFPTQTGGNTWSAAYRADGLRAWTKDSSTAAKIYHYYDGGNSVLERYEDGSIYAATYYAPDGLASRQSGPSSEAWTYHFLFDWQGNAVHTLDDLKNPYVHMAYNAWGQRNYAWPASPPADVKSFGYNARWGYRTDEVTGLVYCQNRYYDAANGRWLTRDPIGYAGGINLYGYCGGGPVRNADPSGLTNLVSTLLVKLEVAIAAAEAAGNLALAARLSAAAAALSTGAPGAANAAQRLLNSPVDELASELADDVANTMGSLASRASQPCTSVLEAAQRAYPNLAGKLENHHIEPLYLGGAKNGPTVRIDAALHQQITNAWRSAYPYGAKDRDLSEVGKVMEDIGKQFGIPTSIRIHRP